MRICFHDHFNIPICTTHPRRYETRFTVQDLFSGNNHVDGDGYIHPLTICIQSRHKQVHNRTHLLTFLLPRPHRVRLTRIILDSRKLGAKDGRPGLSLWGVMQAAIIYGGYPNIAASGETWRSTVGSLFHGAKSNIELRMLSTLRKQTNAQPYRNSSQVQTQTRMHTRKWMASTRVY